MDKLIGGFFSGLAKFVEGFFDLLIWMSVFLTNISRYLSKLIGSILLIGCSFFFFIPIIIFALPLELMGFLIIITLISLLGNLAVSKLEYYKYISTEYLYDTAAYYKSGRKKEPFRNYQNQYKEMKREEAQKRHEEERRAYEEEMRRRQEEFRERYKDFTGFGAGYGGYWNQGPGSYGGSGSSYQPTQSSFKENYEKAADTLGLAYTADEYEIKLAYRKLAKKYHPDLNQGIDTTKKFQEINSAYEFLNEENIRRYRNLA